MTGIPCSGKTTRAKELKEYFETKKEKKVQIISEAEAISKATFDKNTFYAGKFSDHFFYHFIHLQHLEFFVTSNFTSKHYFMPFQTRRKKNSFVATSNPMHKDS